MYRNLRAVLRNISRMLAISWRMDRRLTLLYYLTAGLAALAPVATGITLKLLIDHLVFKPGIDVTVPLVVVVIVAAHYALLAANTVVRFGLNEQYYDYLFRYKLQNEFSYRFSEKLTLLDIEHLEDPEVQNLITKVRETHQWRLPDFLRNLSYAFFNVVSYVAAAIAVLPFGWWIVPVVTAVTLPRLYLRARFGNIQWSIYGSGAPQARKLWYFSWLLSENSSLREMKVFQTGPALLGKFRGVQDYLLDLNLGPLRKYRRVTVMAPVLEGAAVFVIAYLALPSVVSGALSVGSYAFFTAMLQQLVTSAASAGVNCGVVYEDSLYVDYFMDLLALPRLITESASPVSFPVAPPRIEFRDVCFVYPNGRSVLDHVSFTIEPGESIAIVGINGAGKSTIIKLLCRFYDVTSGVILINGVDIRLLDLSNWYRHIGTLFQDFVSYKLSVRDNIMLGDPAKADEALIHEAAIKAGADDFIRALPGGYDQILGNDFADGEQLSGGQWQKLAIARAFYQSAPVLIMDEPTSAIDAEAEFEIFTNLEAEYRAKTLILVSHRFSTVRNADRILVVDDGHVLESGTHDDLVLAGGKYAAMFGAQAAGYR